MQHQPEGKRKIPTDMNSIRKVGDHLVQALNSQSNLKKEWQA